MQTYQIGSPYVAGVVRWPERDDYAVPRLGQGHRLCRFAGKTAGDMAAAVTGGPGDVAAACVSGVLFLLYRFENEAMRGHPWSAAAYVRGQHPAPPMGATDSAASLADAANDVLTVLVVDAATGMVRGLRRLPIPAALATGLDAAVRNQDARTFRGDYLYSQEVARVRAIYPSADHMLSRAFGTSHFAAR